MDFERSENINKNLRIGREEDLIRRIDAALKRESGRYSDFYLDRTPMPNNPERIATWIQRDTGYYFALIKNIHNQGFTRTSKWPDYYIAYDLGLHYGNEVVENLAKNEI